MKLKLLLASAFLATTASAAVESESKVIARFDYINEKQEVTATPETTRGEMEVSFLRWKNAAKFNETITGELTLDFTEPANGASGTITDFIDTAFITKSFGPGFTATIGKQAILTGGRENDWSDVDMYATSAFKDAINSNLIGATLGYTVAEQTLYVQYLEGTTTTLTDKKVVGAAWYGNLMNNMINPIVSYHKEGTDRAGQYDISMSAGLQFNMDAFLVEADYLTRNNEAVVGTTDSEIKSMVAHVRYNHENFRPFVKYIKDDGEGMTTVAGGLTLGGTTAEQERTAYEVGLEYTPNKDEAMRYHVVYNMAETENSSGAAYKNETSTIFAGLKWDLSL